MSEQGLIAADFIESFHFAFGILHKQGENFNIFSNRYFDLMVNELSDGGVVKEVP